MRSTGGLLGGLIVAYSVAAALGNIPPSILDSSSMSNLMESFYVKLLSVMSESKDFGPLTPEDIQWLLARLDNAPGLRSSSGKKKVLDENLVHDFLCERRSLSKFCSEVTLGGIASRVEEKPRKLRIATKNCEPFVTCRENVTSQKGDTDEPVGYSIDFWKYIANYHEFEPHFDYQITCYDSTPSVLREVSNGNADLGLACISVLRERMEQMEFSRVYYYSGLEVLVMRPVNSRKNPLSVFDPFTPGVWCCVFVLLILVGIAVYFFERKRNTHMKKDIWKGLALGQWHSWTTFLQNPFMNYRSLPARITMWGFLIVSLVIVATYTANLAAFLTRQRFVLPVRGRGDLSGKIVGTSAVNTSSYNWVTQMSTAIVRPIVDDTERFRQLELGHVDAVVWDSPSLRYRAHKDCDKGVVGEPFQLEDYAIVMQAGEKLRAEIDRRIVRLREVKKSDELYSEWFISESKCDAVIDSEDASDNEDPVSLETTWVLFVFQLGILALASVLHSRPIIANMLKKRKQKDRLACSDISLNSNSVSFADAIGAGPLGKSNAELVGGVPQEAGSLNQIDRV